MMLWQFSIIVGANNSEALAREAEHHGQENEVIYPTEKIGNHVTVRSTVRTTGIPMHNNSINRYGNPNATRGYSGGKSHSHRRLVKQRQLKIQLRRKRKAEIVSVSVLSKALCISQFFANLALPGGRAFANPVAIPALLTRTRFPIRI